MYGTLVIHTMTDEDETEVVRRDDFHVDDAIAKATEWMASGHPVKIVFVPED